MRLRSSFLALIVLALPFGSAQAAIDISTGQIGRLTSSGTSQSRTFNEYDAAGRAVATQHVLQGHSSVFRTQFGYPQNPASTVGLGTVVISQTFPDGETVTYTYDASGQQVSVRGTLQGLTDDIVRDVRANARGQVTRTELGNGTVTTLQYDDSGNQRLKRITTVTGSGQTIQDIQYGYDNDTNVTSTVDSVYPADSFTLQYDELGQMTAMLDAAGTTALERYQYDGIGNLLLAGSIAQTYGTGGAAGRPHALDRSGGAAYSYDDNGNVTAIGASTSLQWNAVNMPTRIMAGAVIAEKAYVDTTLWRKAEQGVTTYYLPSMRVENAIARKFYGAFAERGGLDLTPNGRQLRFYHRDHLGSSSLVTDQGGAPIHAASYMPWGGDRGVEGPFRPKLRFNFKEKDATGFYDYGARLYNPLSGRWLSPDTSLADGPNRYAYARNNPWTKIDPTGHESQDPRGPIDQEDYDPELEEWRQRQREREKFAEDLNTIANFIRGAFEQTMPFARSWFQVIVEGDVEGAAESAVWEYATGKTFSALGGFLTRQVGRVADSGAVPVLYLGTGEGSEQVLRDKAAKYGATIVGQLPEGATAQQIQQASERAIVETINRGGRVLMDLRQQGGKYWAGEAQYIESLYRRCPNCRGQIERLGPR
ncbi:MAG TPA: RHS repeat-associated core domain-containing protein [Thermoanaerobaculia bacterium]|nr:RHS repeat-associated core domain-containing protein [Thermoanaerobaculia bacterium]